MTYPAHSSRLPWLALLLPAALAAPGIAAARPVTAADIQIFYRFVDSEGKATTTELTANDLNNYVNRARCQCGEQVAAQVNLLRSMDQPYDDQRIRTFVGSQCAQGQDAPVGSMVRPCVRYFEGQPFDYDDGGIDIVFETVWLSSRVESISDQSPETAPPIDPCQDDQFAEGGVWICVEDGMQTDCQGNEFIIQGTQSQNGSTTGTPTDPTQGGGVNTSTGGIVFDYQPPQAVVTGFTSSPGDGAVEISWSRSESTQINGFRVLCADLEGNPVPGKGATLPVQSQRTNGKLYYTAENLCPGAVVYDGEASNVPDLPLPGGDEGDGGSTGGGTGAGMDLWGDGWMLGGGTATGTGGTSGTGDTSGTGGTRDTETDGASSTDGRGSTTADGSTGTTGDGGGMSVTDSPLSSLDWAFVCSDHISGTGTSARVDGLENGREYQFIVVAYDRAGNPLIVSGDEVMVETPEQTTDFWEQCEQQGDLCGDGGFCQCRAGSGRGAAWLGSGLLLLALVGLRRGGRS
ncbi:MAG: hypothetical protein AB1Z98_36045 [Nannocystaceae bacterium]